MPLLTHLLKRQHWQRFLNVLVIWQLLTLLQMYGVFRRTERRKKPCQKENGTKINLFFTFKTCLFSMFVVTR